MKIKLFNMNKKIILWSAMFLATGLFPIISMNKNISILKKNLDEKLEKKSKYDNILIFDANTKSERRVSFFELICGSIAAEMPACFHSEALKAQGVVIVTYFLRENGLENSLFLNSSTNKSCGKPYIRHFCYISKDKRKKKWGKNFEKYEKKIQNVVKEIQDKVLLYKNEIAFTPFFSWCYKKTVPCKWGFFQDLPYLVSVDSFECNDDIFKRKYNKKLAEKTTEIKSEKVKSILKNFFKENKQNIDRVIDRTSPDKWFKIKKKDVTDYGYVIKVDILGKQIKGSKLENILGLRSANFTIKYNKKNDEFAITTLGNGHGVGMSQYGAHTLARLGKDYKYILNHYYPNTELWSINKKEKEDIAKSR